MGEKIITIELPKEIIKQIGNQKKFYTFFRAHKKANIGCIILQKFNITDKEFEIFKKRYKSLWKGKKPEYEYAFCELVKLNKKREIRFESEYIIPRILAIRATTGLFYYYDKDIDSIIIYNKGLYELKKEIIENN